MERIIIHSDLNNFYASVECLHRPGLRNKPLAVCGDAELRHGIVLAKNYIAKKYGIKTGDVIWEAKQKCPNLEIVSANFNLYLRFSKLVRNIYERYTDKVESFGIDECWLDVTDCRRSGKEIADEIRQTIIDEIGITASVGVSWNKIYAKLGSDMNKPNATTVISKENYKKIIWHLPVNELLYVGKATASKLSKYAIKTIGNLAESDLDFLIKRLGKWGEYLWTFANGYDLSPVANIGDEGIVKSIGNSTTAVRDLLNEEDVTIIATVLSESVAERLRDQHLRGATVFLGLRDYKLAEWGKQLTLAKATNLSKNIIQTVMELYKSYNHENPIRGMSIKLSNLSLEASATQLDIFGDFEKTEKQKNLELCIDNIRNRFGHYSINRAIEYKDKKLANFDPKKENTIHPYSYFK